MTDYREILRLSGQGISQRGIASSCRCSRNTVAKVLERARAKGAKRGGLEPPARSNRTSGALT